MRARGVWREESTERQDARADEVGVSENDSEMRESKLVLTMIERDMENSIFQ